MYKFWMLLLLSFFTMSDLALACFSDRDCREGSLCIFKNQDREGKCKKDKRDRRNKTSKQIDDDDDGDRSNRADDDDDDDDRDRKKRNDDDDDDDDRGGRSDADDDDDGSSYRLNQRRGFVGGRTCSWDSMCGPNEECYKRDHSKFGRCIRRNR